MAIHTATRGYEVIWSGRDSLLPDRSERWDTRLDTMPTLEEEDEVVSSKPKRKYTRTGKHTGKFSRTNPAAAHFKPTIKKVTNNG
jgi:hypothetical protein